jgi:hypothetical protein
MTNNGKFIRPGSPQWVAIADMEVNPSAQREWDPAWSEHIALNFDPGQLGEITISFRNGHYYVVDGRHRIEAMKLMGWGDQQLLCQVFTDLTEELEAEKFIQLNDVKIVGAMPKYRAAITAGRPDAVAIEKIVHNLGLVVTSDRIPGAIGAVKTLQTCYRRNGGHVLERALRIIRDSFGERGFEQRVLAGIVFLVAHYEEALDDDLVIDKLGSTRGGVNGLLGAAEVIRGHQGGRWDRFVAEAAVKIVNHSTPRGDKLAKL